MSEGQTSCQIRAETQAFVDREIKHLKDITERTTALKDEALLIQRTEYLRRLDELNNAHARAEAAVRATVPRETFDVFVANYNRWREEVIAETGNIRSAAATRERIFYLFITIAGLLLSGITIWINFKSK